MSVVGSPLPATSPGEALEKKQRLESAQPLPLEWKSLHHSTKSWLTDSVILVVDAEYFWLRCLYPVSLCIRVTKWNWITRRFEDQGKERIWRFHVPVGIPDNFKRLMARVPWRNGVCLSTEKIRNQVAKLVKNVPVGAAGEVVVAAYNGSIDFSIMAGLLEDKSKMRTLDLYSVVRRFAATVFEVHHPKMLLTLKAVLRRLELCKEGETSFTFRGQHLPQVDTGALLVVINEVLNRLALMDGADKAVCQIRAKMGSFSDVVKKQPHKDHPQLVQVQAA